MTREHYTVEKSGSDEFGVFEWVIFDDSGMVQARTWHQQLAEDIAKALNAAAMSSPAPSGWQPIETAPKGSGWDGPRDTRHPDYVQPPRILGIVHGEPEVIYWDWYYAEGGEGYQPGQSAWVGADGNVTPTRWMPLPLPPVEP